MAGIGCRSLGGAPPIFFPSPSSMRVHMVRCCSNSTPSKDSNYSYTPNLLKLAVSGVTELLRLLSPSRLSSRDKAGVYEDEGEILPSSVDDVLAIIKSDYEKNYFLTGIFTPAVYADDCIFEDPTIEFRGTELYARNLQLLVPFFEQPSIILQGIEKGVDSKRNFVLAKWSLRTYLKLPRNPLISIDGSTVYDLNDQFKVRNSCSNFNVRNATNVCYFIINKDRRQTFVAFPRPNGNNFYGVIYRIVRHAESWNVSALEAVGQIFRPSHRHGKPSN